MSADPLAELLDPQPAPVEHEDPRRSVDLPRLKRMWEQFRDLTAENRKLALVDDDYYHGQQLSPGEIAALSERGQPDIVINRTRAAVNGILGVIERGRTDPRAYPRTPKDDDGADVATDTLRYIGDKNRFDRVKVRAFRDMLVPGAGAAIVTVNQDLEVIIERIRFEEFFYDPRSREEDFSDAKYLGIAKWMYADDVVEMYPEDRAGIYGAVDSAAMMDEATADRPDGMLPTAWVDRRQRRVLMVEIYYREGGWKRCVYHAGGVLAYGDSPYHDDKGRPCCPIEAATPYVDRKNNRTGLVRDMKGPQDEINKRRSKLLHLITVSQVQMMGPEALGYATDPDEARREAARPDGVIPPGWIKVPTSDHAAGQAQLLQEAKGEIERLGPNPAVIGRESAGASGRALQARTQAGMIELAIVFGTMEDWELRIWRQCWSRAKQFWRSPQWIRVTDDEDAPKYVGLNMPKGPPQPVVDPQTGEPEVDPKTGEPKVEDGDPSLLPRDATGQPIPVFGYKNTVAEIDVDIILDATPDTANIQAEQFRELAQLAANPAYAGQVPFDTLLKLSSMPHKREVVEELKAHREQQQQAMQQQAEQAAQLAQAKAQADIRQVETKATLNEAQAEATTFNAQVDGATAQVNNAIAVQKAMQPQPVDPAMGY